MPSDCVKDLIKEIYTIKAIWLSKKKQRSTSAGCPEGPDNPGVCVSLHVCVCVLTRAAQIMTATRRLAIMHAQI